MGIKYELKDGGKTVEGCQTPFKGLEWDSLTKRADLRKINTTTMKENPGKSRGKPIAQSQSHNGRVLGRGEIFP